MKFKQHSVVLLLLLAVPLISFLPADVSAQADLQIAFQKNGKTFLIDSQKNKQAQEIINVSALEEKISDQDLWVRSPGEISKDLIIPDKWVLYTGIQSPYDQTIWLCLERTIMGNDFNLFLFDTKNGSKKTLINKNNATGNYAFRPLGWSTDKNKIYIERIIFDNADEHEGIFGYSINTAELKQINISAKYMSTPLISPDRKYFTYLVTGKEERDLVHGFGDKLMSFSIVNNQEILVSEEKDVVYRVLGWYSDSPIKKKELSGSVKRNDQINPAQINFKLPYVAGVNNCVTRDGSVAPTGPIGSSTSCSDLGQHSYPAATDFDTPNNSNEKTLAVAAGTVTSVIYGNTGYGNHVIITHADNYRSLYGHFFSIAVTQGQQVAQGCYLGYEGTTGNSSGDHIHFEYEYPGGSGNLYATFDECGCFPHRGYSYTSGNSLNPCSGPPPPPPVNDNCSGAQTLTSTINCIQTAGDIAASTASGLAQPSCDGFMTPALQDVWYQFVATATTHSITVTPGGDFDAVLSLYSSCSAGGEIGCADNGGGAGATEIINVTGLVIGNTYYVRVYDYGSLAPTTSTFDICVTEPNATTGTAEIGSAASSFYVYPNPSDGIILHGKIADADASVMSVKIYGMVGREIFSKQIIIQGGEFSLLFDEHLKKGMYTLVGIANDKQYVKRILVR